jgi:hypothetical protein
MIRLLHDSQPLSQEEKHHELKCRKAENEVCGHKRWLGALSLRPKHVDVIFLLQMAVSCLRRVLDSERLY